MPEGIYIAPYKVHLIEPDKEPSDFLVLPKALLLISLSTITNKSHIGTCHSPLLTYSVHTSFSYFCLFCSGQLLTYINYNNGPWRFYTLIWLPYITLLKMTTLSMIPSWSFISILVRSFSQIFPDSDTGSGSANFISPSCLSPFLSPHF